ncbi:MAG: Gfo/Idh/MocA family oxidoreductase [Anaerolineae bacterium]
MESEQFIRLGFMGCGGMARHHIKAILEQDNNTKITAVCEPSSDAYLATAAIFRDAGLDLPPNQPNWQDFVNQYNTQLDVVFIVTPHVYHYEQAKACLEAGLDVLLEKPMVMTANEANDLINVRDRTGKLLVVAFQGSLSPQVRTAVSMLRTGELGNIHNINAMVWQNWDELTKNTWRQQPELAGGGFLFDTGAHMLNTVADLAGEDFEEVVAWVKKPSKPGGYNSSGDGAAKIWCTGDDERLWCRNSIMPFRYSGVL